MKSKAFLFLVAVQAFVVIGLSAYHGYHRASGISILLETVPVDPRDMLRGDYVILRYKISTLRSNLFAAPLPSGNEAEGRTVYVTLENHDRFHEAVSASFDPPGPEPGQVVISGTVRNSWTENELRVEYGLERYYVAEGTGNPIGKITAEVSVSPSGRGIIREVFIDDQPYAEVMGIDR